ncbi:Scd6-like Sm domain-containing protein [Flammula alnicola]|nr:Scd6-like Sm domain-containing protein [Flammula alnicola]
MALSFIGKPISLISHSDVRYRGILAGIDPQASTIQLSNVYSMGTESRRPPNQFIAPVQDPYAYIIFRASEVKDLSVDEPAAAQPHNVHDDPAVLGAAPAPAPKQPSYAPYVPGPPNGTNSNPSSSLPPPPPYVQQGQPSGPAPVPQQQPQPVPIQPTPAQPNRGIPQTAPTNRRPNPVHTAAASLETVERALGDLRVSGGGAPTHPTHGGGRGGHGRRGPQRGGRGEAEQQLKVPTTDFDFAGSNAKFDKAAHSPAGTKENTEDGTTSGGDDAEKPAEKEAEQPAYNPQKSFFDSLSSSSATPAGASGSGGGYQGNSNRGRRGGGQGGAGRNRREEEREKNVATFGEPGGVGLLGPGGYVGGWGGYGRRGGRPRRGGGGGRGGGNGPPPVQARG